MSAKHTPGPWAVDNDIEGYSVQPKEFYCRVYARDPGPGKDFTVAFVRDSDPRTRAANARLMAASPDLLDALKELRLAAQGCEAMNHQKYDQLGIKVNAAIKKAEGATA